MDKMTSKLLSNPQTSLLQQVFTNYLVYMPITLPGDRDLAVNKANNADPVEKPTNK